MDFILIFVILTRSEEEEKNTRVAFFYFLFLFVQGVWWAELVASDSYHVPHLLLHLVCVPHVPACHTLRAGKKELIFLGRRHAKFLKFKKLANL